MNGTRLLHYQITAQLGRGGMGEVYRATDTRLGREVAIKVLPAAFSQRPDSLARLEREARALAALNHPHIAGIHGFDSDHGTYFLVLELVEGETLAERLARGPLPVKEVLTIGRQIAEAMQEAHDKGIIHRDLKPGNVKITPNGRVKVLDFGLAKMEQSARSNTGPTTAPDTGEDAPTVPAGSTVAGTIMGTPAYMSPEQARGRDVDKRTDIWAFGCCLLECLTGRKPFAGQTAADLMADVLKSEPDWSQVPAETPPAVVTLLRRCLEKEPSRRLSSIGDIALTLEETTSASTGSPRPLNTTPATRPAPAAVWSVAAWPGWMLPAATALLMLLAGAAVFFWVRSGPNSHQQGESNRLGSAAVPATAQVRRERKIESLAVKPLDDISGDTNRAYLSDGMTEALCTALGNVSALRVPGRSSVMRYKGGQKSIQEMAKELNVDAIVEGSVQRTITNMLVYVRLIDAATDRQLWSTNYKRDLSDFFLVQGELARAVVSAVQAKLTPQEGTRLASAQTVHPEALEEYLKGRYLWNRMTESGSGQALDHFTRATVLDPGFALAWAAVADIYWNAADAFVAPVEASAKARAAAQRALELDDALAEAHTALGVVNMMVDFDWAQAEARFRRAIELKPSYAVAHWQYGWLLVSLGRQDAALREFQRATELDPLSAVMAIDTNVPYTLTGQYDLAIAQCRKGLELDPNFWLAHFVLGWIELERGTNVPNAIAEYRLAMVETVPFIKGWLGYAYGRNGQKDEARKVLAELDRLSTERFVSPFCQALIYLGLGEYGKAMDWLEKAYEGRSQWLMWLKVEPLLDPLRPDPRFQALVKRMNFPP